MARLDRMTLVRTFNKKKKHNKVWLRQARVDTGSNTVENSRNSSLRYFQAVFKRCRHKLILSKDSEPSFGAAIYDEQKGVSAILNQKTM